LMCSAGVYWAAVTCLLAFRWDCMAGHGVSSIVGEMFRRLAGGLPALFPACRVADADSFCDLAVAVGELSGPVVGGTLLRPGLRLCFSRRFWRIGKN